MRARVCVFEEAAYIIQAQLQIFQFSQIMHLILKCSKNKELSKLYKLNPENCFQCVLIVRRIK